MAQNKYRRKHNRHFGTSFFYDKFTLWHIKLHKEKQVYEKYLIGLIFSGISKKIHTSQVYYKFFYSVWKETTNKPSKVVTSETFFSSVYVIVITCFDKCFLFHMITGRNCFL